MFKIKPKKRTIIIGLDGVPYGAIKRLAARGIMKNTHRLIKEGTFRQMTSSIPEISSVAWSSIITGKNPAEHGIFGFIDLYPESYQIRFPNFNDLKSKPFWHLNERQKSIIINVPSTYPVKPLNGVHISGFVSIDYEKSIYPKSLAPKLKQLNYKIDVDAQLAHKSIDLFLEDLDKTLDARIKTYQYLWDEYRWSTFMLVFTGTDRLGHFLWDALDNENHKYREDFLNHFAKIDKAIGEIASKINENDLFVMLSDHGFEEIEENVNINYLLKQKGFLKIEEDTEQKLINVDESTKAFALDPARIYINEEGKHPKGSVNKNDKRKVLDGLKDIFNALERNGKKVIRKIYKREDIYDGPYIESAPDLVLVGNKGFNLKAKVDTDALYEKNIFKGKHTQDDAFIIINKKCDSLIPDGFSVSDVLGLLRSVS